MSWSFKAHQQLNGFVLRHENPVCRRGDRRLLHARRTTGGSRDWRLSHVWQQEVLREYLEAARTVYVSGWRTAESAYCSWQVVPQWSIASKVDSLVAM